MDPKLVWERVFKSDEEIYSEMIIKKLQKEADQKAKRHKLRTNALHFIRIHEYEIVSRKKRMEVHKCKLCSKLQTRKENGAGSWSGEITGFMFLVAVLLTIFSLGMLSSGSSLGLIPGTLGIISAYITLKRAME